MNTAMPHDRCHAVRSPRAELPASRRRRSRSAISNFYYGDNKALKNISLPLYDRKVDGVHRPVGLRQVDAAARPQPHLRPLSQPARRGRGPARRREHPVAEAGPQPAARPHRHGVPEADARSRCRSTTTSPSASGSTRRLPQVRARRPRRDGAAPRRAVGRGQGQARRQRPEPVGRPAAAPVHRAHGRGQARGDPARRAVLGARSDLDRQDRGADRRAEDRLHDRHRHPQHAAGRARLRLHRLHVSRRADRVRHRPARSSRPRATGAPRTTSPAASAECDDRQKAADIRRDAP